jgi:hypothetical protein
MLHLEVNLDGLERKLDLAIDNAADLEKPLRIFGGYLRKKAVEKWKAQDFAPLAASTIEHRTQKGLRRLERKLFRDVKRALGKTRTAQPRGILARLLGVGSEDVGHGTSKAVLRRQAVLAEFQRRHGRTGEKGALAGRMDLPELSLKALISLGGREDRAVAKAVGKPILGWWQKGMKVDVQGDVVSLTAQSHRHWTEIHNEGGTAGHGAQIPKRETLKLDEHDLDVLEDLVKDWIVKPLAEESPADA